MIFLTSLSANLLLRSDDAMTKGQRGKIPYECDEEVPKIISGLESKSSGHAELL